MFPERRLGPRVVIAAATGCIVAASFARSAGCSSADTSSGGGGGAKLSSSKASSSSTSASVAVTTAASTGAGGASTCPYPGWYDWNVFTGFSAKTFCVPSSKALLPGPIEWESCPANAGLTAPGCRRMKITWPYVEVTMAVNVSGSVESDGRVILQFTRLAKGADKYRMMVVAEADGPIRTAFLDPQPNPSSYISSNSSTQMGVRHGKYIFLILDGAKFENFSETILGGAVDDLTPTVLWDSDTSNGHAIGTSDAMWGTHNSFEIGLASFGATLAPLYTGKEAGGLRQPQLYFWHDLAWWQSGSVNYSNIMAYTPKKGVYPFISFGNDTSQGAHGIATDGKQIAWVYSHGRQPGDTVYPVRDIMVSPFTTDPAALKPKRLRSYPWPYSVINPLAVGCGYAAYAQPGQAFIVRLSDGVSWWLPEGGCKLPLDTEWCWDDVYAITCDELFLRGGGPAQTIARVRLDALGPGKAAD